MNDVNYGAGQEEEVEKHLYKLQDGTYKKNILLKIQMIQNF